MWRICNVPKKYALDFRKGGELMKKMMALFFCIFALVSCGSHSQVKDGVDPDIKKALYGSDRAAAVRALANPENKGASELSVIRWLYGIGGQDGRGDCSCK